MNRDYLRSQDEFVHQEMFVWNVYQLFEKDIKGSRILDIGGHYGMFSIAVTDLGAKSVLAIEANPNNAGKYIQNTKDIPNVKLLNVAVSTKTGDLIKIENTGGTSRVNHGDITVGTIAFTDALAMMSSDSKIIVKMDIEGAEHDIIRNTDPKEFDKIDVLIMELHSEGISGTGNSIQGLSEYILTLGFKLTWRGQYFLDNGEVNTDIEVHKFEKN